MSKQFDIFPKSSTIDADLDKRRFLLINAPGKIEFILPASNYLNGRLFHNLPTANVNESGKIQTGGQMGQIKYFYIPSEKHKTLYKLFDQFKIPEELRADLTGAYINMSFAKWTASYFTQSERNFKENENNLSEALLFLSELVKRKINITAITLEYQDILPDPNDSSKSIFGDKEKKKFEGTMSVGLLEESLKLYENVELFDMFKLFAESSKSSSRLDSFMGHKNAEKHSQNYYCSAIFEYLRKTLFKYLFNFLETPEIYQKEVRTAKRKYSQRQLFWFIGELMILSELVDTPDAVEDDIVDYIKKKLTPEIKARKERITNIEERNRNSTDGTYEVIQFDDLF